jgi:hypothetical protein
MKTATRKRFRITALAATIAGLMITGAATTANAAGPIVPVDRVVAANTYAEWSIRWWQWVLGIPYDVNPNYDTTGEFCAEGQSGPVWFLAGAFLASGTVVTRDCAVPAGAYLFFPLVNGAFGSGVFDCDPTVPGTLCDLNALRASVGDLMRPNRVTVFLEIDGVRMTNLKNYRVTSREFTLTYPENNAISALAGMEVPAGTYGPQVSDGYWIMLRPLTPGTHTIHFKGTIANQGAVDVTYNLTVGP